MLIFWVLIFYEKFLFVIEIVYCFEKKSILLCIKLKIINWWNSKLYVWFYDFYWLIEINSKNW